MRRARGNLLALAAAATMITGAAWASPASAAPATAAPAVTNSIATMPYVVGLKLADAQRRVVTAGLSPYVQYIDNDCTINRVAGQNPGAGTQLAAGTQVFLLVHPICNGPQP